MKMKYTLSFLFGFLSCIFVIFIIYFFNSNYFLITSLSVYGNLSPSNRVRSDEILVFSDEIVLKIPNATISNYANTGSMRPILDEGAKGIRVVPKSEDEVNVGDIVSFRQDKKLIVHRVVEKGRDDKGIYFITKGDNNLISDGKIRFSDIEYLTVGVIW